MLHFFTKCTWMQLQSYILEKTSLILKLSKEIISYNLKIPERSCLPSIFCWQLIAIFFLTKQRTCVRICFWGRKRKEKCPGTRKLPRETVSSFPRSPIYFFGISMNSINSSSMEQQWYDMKKITMEYGLIKRYYEVRVYSVFSCSFSI